jgi:hypothetical protein
MINLDLQNLGSNLEALVRPASPQTTLVHPPPQMALPVQLPGTVLGGGHRWGCFKEKKFGRFNMSCYLS